MRPESAWAFGDLVPVEDEAFVALMNEAFSDYLAGPAHMDVAAIRAFFQAGAVDRTRSVVAREQGRLVGAALVGTRGDLWRVATMGIVPSQRRRGLGNELLSRVLAQARQHGCRELQLEVFERNSGALSLYLRHGFLRKRRLNGWSTTESPRVHAAVPPCSFIEAGDIAALGPLRDFPELPWQNSPWGASQAPQPLTYLCAEGMAVAVSGVSSDTPVLRSVFIGAKRPASDLALLLHALRAQFADKRWMAPAFWPEEFDSAFEEAGFVRAELNQLQMGLAFGKTQGP